MAKNDKMPGHKWRTTGVIPAGGSRFFVYQCSKCYCSTRNGAPLVPPDNTQCVKPPHTFGKR